MQLCVYLRLQMSPVHDIYSEAPGCLTLRSCYRVISPTMIFYRKQPFFVRLCSHAYPHFQFCTEITTALTLNGSLTGYSFLVTKFLIIRDSIISFSPTVYSSAHTDISKMLFKIDDCQASKRPDADPSINRRRALTHISSA